MDIEEIYINLLTQPFGSRYFKTDLHIHLEPNSYENGKLTSYCKELFEILSENEIEIIALTVHREESLKYLFIAIDILMGLAKDNNYSLEIFPSIELKDVRNTHFAVIFDNNKTKVSPCYGHVFFVNYGRIDERIIKEWVEITKNIISRLSL